MSFLPWSFAAPDSQQAGQVAEAENVGFHVKEWQKAFGGQEAPQEHCGGEGSFWTLPSDAGIGNLHQSRRWE